MKKRNATQLTNALTGEPVKHDETVFAKVGATMPANALETLRRAFELDADKRGPQIHQRVIANDGSDAIATITGITARIIGVDARVTKHNLMVEDTEQAQRIETGQRPEQINIEIEINSGASISLNTDFAIIPMWGSTVKNASMVVTRNCTLNEDQLAKMIDTAFIDNELQRRKLASHAVDEDIRMEHTEAAQIRAARVLSSTVREGDAKALAILANVILLGEITESGDNDDTTYTIVIKAPHKNAGDISVRVDGPPVEDGTWANFEVSAEQHIREMVTVCVRAPDAEAAERLGVERITDGAQDWAGDETVENSFRVTNVQQQTERAHRR